MPFRSNKPARLEKPRTNDNSGSKPSPARHDDADDTSLRSPNRYSIQSLSHQQLVTRQRQLLLRQASDNSPSPKNGQDRLGRSAINENDPYGDPKASTSTVNTIVNDIEARSRIDVEQAIGLLQELKKTASPDELVALHRALLPVKEDTPPPASALPSIEERAYTSIPPDRRRSVIPPGLATRSGSSDDILRRPSDPSSVPTPKKPQRDTWMFETPREQRRNDSPSRLSTRSEQAYCHAGAFASGTLRITNGAASPEPSIISKLALESNDVEEEGKSKHPASAVDARSSLQSLRERRSEDAGSTRSYRLSVLDHQSSETLRPAGPRPGSLDFHSRQQSKVRAELRLDPPLQRHSFQHIPDSPAEDAPRFQQRWSHRAAFLSQEYALDCDITESPYEEKNGLSEFGNRLSTVHDDGESEYGEYAEVDHNSRADALSRLTGVFEGEATGAEDDIGTARTSDEAKPSSQQDEPTMMQDKVVRKVDSGYCSDASTSPLQRKSSAEAGKPRIASAIQEQPSSPHQGSDQYVTDSDLPADSRGSTNDTSSLLTFEEMVTSSPQTDAAWNTSPSQTTKKSPLSLFKSKSKATRKSSFNVLNVYHGDRPRTSDGSDAATFAEPSPPPSRSGPADKPSKKLQKPMPESVRRQRKKTMEDLKANMSQHSPTVQNLLADGTATQEDSDCFIGCQPKEPVGDREQSQEQAKSLRHRSKSFVGRKRSKTVGESEDMSEQPSASSGPSRKRSKSNADHTAPIPVRANEEAVPSMNCLKSHESETPARDRPVPAHADFASVARALQSHPPDPSPAARRSAPVPKRSSMQRYYSLHKIDIPVQEPSTAQDDGAKQEPESNVQAQETPHAVQDERTVTEQRPALPSHHTSASVSSSALTTPVAVGSSYSVEDRFPGWQGKPASPNATPPQTPVHSPSSSVSWLSLRNNRSQSALPSGIPPLPELPADIAAKVSRADQMVAKKMRLSPRSSPSTSARNSIDSVDTRKQLLARKAEARKEQDEERSKEARQAALDKLNVPREEDEDAADRPAADRARWSVDGSIQLPRPEEQPLPASPTHDSQHPGWPGWEQQSSLWRQRREALAQSLDTADQGPIDEVPQQTCDSPSTPGIVVSRYITPLGAENAHNAYRAMETEHDSAKKYAQEYTSLIEDDKENTPSRPAIPRADSVVSTATLVTMQSSSERPVRVNPSRSNSELSSYTTTTTVSSTTTWSNSNHGSNRSPFNRDRQQHMRTKSGRFVAYRPSDASQAERSRALSLARRSTQQAATSSAENLAVPPPRPELKKSSSETLFDRFGGGMQYGWDRDSGSFGGSAGMRSSGEVGRQENRNRKSVKMSEEFGLDLSDVPVFLRRGETFSTAFHG
ncbi:hypothetical protein M409DRAFT_52999 [Zasmidium cellare ATCC 36951]|uniref:Uncharacterized protein n=1 Tax=Zasmidium cellare ATCC 36951 TaxID=1080233 RepID=A0A6A6CQS0_ZASCE|nr:uncharacterized protein M409DRAFT_52999 [Zasmidium cellare ATCC 36951]KAF2169033.1 hypothetical protein M409DRAFT_52999 [Zasmidium cellare ATCC 36951]